MFIYIFFYILMQIIPQMTSRFSGILNDIKCNFILNACD